MQPDTRKLLTTGSIIFAVAAISALLMFTVLGGVSRQGPHNSLGWMALLLTMGCGPTGLLTLALGLAKLARRR
jgi:hypothetical protein